MASARLHQASCLLHLCSLSLREIQQEEEERQRALAAVAAAEAEEAEEAATLVASLAAVRAGSSGGWGASAGPAAAPPLREVMQREAAGSSNASVAAAEDDDGGLFWDYGLPAKPAAAVAAQAPPAPAPRKPAAPVPKASGWATAVAATTPGAVPAAPPKPAAAARAAPAAVRAAPAPAPAPAPATPAARDMDPADAAAIAEAMGEAGSSALTGAARWAPSRGCLLDAQLSVPARTACPSGRHAIQPNTCENVRPSPSLPAHLLLAPPRCAGAFRGWCQEQMRELTGSADVTLCEFLLTVESNSELAEYCTLYLGSSPGVSRQAGWPAAKHGQGRPAMPWASTAAGGGSACRMGRPRHCTARMAPGLRGACIPAGAGRRRLPMGDAPRPRPPSSAFHPPSAAPPQVARFAAEFMKRKLAEAAAASKSSRSRKSKAKAAAAAQPAPAAARPAAPAPAVGPPGYAPPAAAFPALGAAAAQPVKKDTDWEKVGSGWDGTCMQLLGASWAALRRYGFANGCAAPCLHGTSPRLRGLWRGCPARRGHWQGRLNGARRFPVPPGCPGAQGGWRQEEEEGRQAGLQHAGLCQRHQLRAAGAARVKGERRPCEGRRCRLLKREQRERQDHPPRAKHISPTLAQARFAVHPVPVNP